MLNNYCRVLDVLFGPDCPHLTHVSAIRDGLETHEAELESRLTGVLILHLMWRVHHDARQFFLACERWEDGEQLPHSTLGNTVRQLVDDCAIQVTITCPEAMFLGPPVRLPAPTTPSTPRAARVTGSQPTVNAGLVCFVGKIIRNMMCRVIFIVLSIYFLLTQIIICSISFLSASPDIPSIVCFNT